MRLAGPLLAVALLTAPAAAQEIRGTISLPDGGTPAVGILVVAERAGVPTPVARAVTGAGGRFVLRIAPGTVRLRALRIGHRPTDLGEQTLAAEERRVVSFTLRDAPVVLQAVTTSAASRCQLAARAGEEVATLFEDARTALLLSQLSPPEGRPAARVVLYTLLTDPRGTPLAAPRREVRTGASARPFQSLPPALLARVGYVTEERDGTVFRAPDATVLTSAEFAAGHCLRLVDGQGERAGWAGLGFEPVQRAREIVGIQGTLWVDRATSELRRLEFSYVGLEAPLDRAGLGGSVDFTRLPDGTWFENRWEIRMPRVSIQQRAGLTGTGDAAARLVILDAIQRTGGEVLSIRRGDRLAFAGDLALEDSLTARGADPPAPVPVDACPASEREGVPTGFVHGTVFDRAPRRAGGAQVTATWRQEFTVVGFHEWRWREEALSTTAAEDGFYALCGAPRDRLLQLRAAAGERRSNVVSVRIPRGTGASRADLDLGGSPPHTER